MITADRVCTTPSDAPHRVNELYPCDVAIIMSTFDGAKFLPDQLESFQDQMDARWKLIWRDDGSRDATTTLMDNFSRRMPPGQVVRARGSDAKLGVFDSYMSLLGEALDTPAVAFADQDDVWLPEKLQRALVHLKTIDPAQPAIYCGRQILVDEALRPIGLSPELRRPPEFLNLLLQNIGTGCTIVMNQTAARAVCASTKPLHSVHDWWACLFVAAIGGTILFDCTPEILYRQHSANVFGASNSYLRRMLRALSRGTEAYNAQLISHVGALLENKQQLSLEVVRVLQKIQHGYAGGRHERLSLFRLPGFRRQTNIENALLALWLLFTSTKTVNQ